MYAYHETKIHGSISFPYTLYGVRIPEAFESFPLHWHDEMEIIYVISGSVVVSVQGDEYVLSDGELVCIQPQLIHSIRQNADEKASYINILFRLSMLENSGADLCTEKFLDPVQTRSLMLQRYIPKGHELCEDLGKCALKLIDIRLSGNSGNELMIKALLFEMLHYMSKCAEPENAEEFHVRSLHEKLKKSIAYVQSNYAEEITVAKAAAVSNFSPGHFSRMFRQLTGCSFTQYLINYRLEMAAKYLSEGEMKISEIAVSCGFNNLSYFTRAFAEKYGMTPRKYKAAADE